MVSANLPAEFGSHRVAPGEIFPELEWDSHGSLGKELVQIFEELTVPDTWMAIRDNGDFTSCHNSIRGDWKEDTTCKIVLIAEIADDLGLDAFGAKSQFFLSREPIPSTIEVRVDGVLQPAANWSFEQSSNSIIFHPTQTPPQSSTVVVDYDTICR